MKRESYTQVKNHAKQDRKRREAYARQDKYDSLTIAEKFTTLIENGSFRQRAKLQKQLDVGVTETKNKSAKVKK